MNKKAIVYISVIVLILIVSAFFFFSVIQKKTPSSTASKSDNITSNTVDKAGNCEAQYQNIIDKFGQNYDDCKIDIKKAQTCDKKPEDAKKQNLVLIFDSSGSMAETIGGQRKIDVIKNAASDFIKQLDKSTNLSIIIYGHKGSNSASDKAASCAGIDEVYYMGPLNSDIAISKFSNLNPKGWTPIGASMQKAGNILSSFSSDANNNLIILASDGQETCGGNPSDVAKTLLNSNAHIITNVIGLNVSGNDEQSLSGIAKNGGGKYFSVKNADDLKNAFEVNKNFMGGFNCYMGQDDVWLGNGLNTDLQEMNCSNRLDLDEKNQIELEGLNTQTNSQFTENCRQYIEQKYQQRYDEIKKQIEDAANKGRQESQEQEKKLEDIKQGMDSGEDYFKN